MSKKNARSKRIAVICIAAALVVGGGGAAFAYWSSSGIGTGEASTGTSEALVVTSEGPTGGPLVPGGESQSVAFTVTNPSTGTLGLSSVVVTVAESDGSTWGSVPGCSADDYVVGEPEIAYGSIGSGGSLTGSVTVTMIDTGVNQDPCQGVPVPLYFVAS